MPEHPDNESEPSPADLRPKPLTLQELLYARGLPRTARVKLVRHRDTSGTMNVHDLYRNNRPGFLDYQRQQGNRVFHGCDYCIVPGRDGVLSGIESRVDPRDK